MSVNLSPRKLPVFVDREVCSSCGGKCCKTAPGMAVPEDFSTTDEDSVRAALIAKLRTGRWTIESGPATPGIKGGYIVRPAIKGSEGRSFTTQTFGVCTFWEPEKGCAVFDERPSQCRALEPRADGRCRDHDEGYAITDSWRPHQDMLELLSVLDLTNEAA